MLPLHYEEAKRQILAKILTKGAKCINSARQYIWDFYFALIHHRESWFLTLKKVVCNNFIFCFFYARFIFSWLNLHYFHNLTSFLLRKVFLILYDFYFCVSGLYTFFLVIIVTWFKPLKSGKSTIEISSVLKNVMLIIEHFRTNSGIIQFRTFWTYNIMV